MGYFYRPNPGLEQRNDGYFRALDAVNRTEYGGRLSLILNGSLARGEGSWITRSGTDDLISDLEFYVVYRGRRPDLRRLRDRIEAAGRVFTDKGALDSFHIDYAVLSLGQLKRLERSFLTFEGKRFGRCMSGEDVTRFLPDVTIQNINLYSIRDIPAHRMFSVLYYGKHHSGSEAEARYFLAKNFLDLGTVLLAMRGQLVGGMTARMAALDRTDLDKSLKASLHRCLAVKSGVPCADWESGEMERHFLQLSLTLHRTFRVRVSNSLQNLPRLVRGRLGILKRGWKARCLPTKNRHFARMYEALQNGCTKRQLAALCREHYVLYGDPKPAKGSGGM